jgi:hypothetical protein
MLGLASCDLFDPTAPYYYYPSYTVAFASSPDESDDMKWKVHLAGLYMNRRGSIVQIGIAGGILQNAPSRIPDQVVTRWSGHDGEARQQEITLKGIVPDMSHFDGTLWFVYHHDQWVVKPVTNDEATYRAIHGASTAPVE